MIREYRPRGPVVLVVEDEPLQRLMAVDLVEEAGFDVSTLPARPRRYTCWKAAPTSAWSLLTSTCPAAWTGCGSPRPSETAGPIELIIVSGKRKPRDEELPARGVFFAKPYKKDEITKSCSGWWGDPR